MDLSHGNNRSLPKPALSVVIPTRDRGRTVGRAVASVLETSGRNVEVVISDDGSSDDTVELLGAIGDPRLVLVVAEKSEGANQARNRGARASTAPIIAFLDSDDAFLPGRSDRLITFFATHPSVDCTIDGFVDHARGHATTHRLPDSTPDPTLLRHMLIAHQIPLTNSTIAVRRDAFEAVGGYDESLRRHQDRDLLLRLLVLKRRIVFTGGVDIHKFRSANSISHDPDGYVDGLDSFAARLPEVSDPRYEDLFRYLLVRGILKAVVQGHIWAAAREMRRARLTKHLPKGLIRSVLRYRAGRQMRFERGGT